MLQHLSHRLSKKNLLPLLVALAMLFGLNSCGGGKGRVGTPTLALVIHAPADGQVVQQESLDVSGEAIGQVGLLKIQGVPVPVDQGRFQTRLTLKEGSNSITFDLWPMPRSGRISDLLPATPPSIHEQRTVILRRVPCPTLVVDLPLDGSQVTSSELAVSGRVDVPSAKVSVNGQVLAVSPEGRFTGQVPLKEGPNVLTFQAESGDCPPSKVVKTVTYQPVLPPDPLQLTVDQPVEGATVRAFSVSYTGRVSHVAAGVTLNGQGLTVQGDGTFTGSFPLVVGSNTLTFTATLAGKAPVTVVRKVNCAAAAQVITLLVAQPVDGLALTTPELGVAGSVSPSSASVTLNGQSLSVAPDGTFSGQTLLTEGPNTLTFRAEAAGLPTATVVRTVTYRKDPPLEPLSLVLDSPADGSVVTIRDVAFSGRVTPAGASVSLNGTPLSSDGSGAFRGQWPLEEGPNTLTFTASMAGRDAVTVRRTVTYQAKPSAPEVTLLSPMDGAHFNTPAIPIKGRVSDPKATLILNGLAATVDGEGRFEGLVGATKAGGLKVVATATNEAGNGEASLYVFYDPSLPVVSFVDPTPAEGSRLTVPSISVTAAVNKPVMGTISGVRAELEPNDDPRAPYLLKAEVPVAEGRVVLQVDVVDAAGNPASVQRTVDVGLSAPMIRFETPQFDVSGTFTTMAESVQVKGWIEAPQAVHPLTCTWNGKPLTLDGEGRFSIPMALVGGANPLRIKAITAFGREAESVRTLLRAKTEGGDPSEAPRVSIERPLDGTATGDASTQVQGRVSRSGLTLQVQGKPVVVDAATLSWTVTVALQQGSNPILAEVKDAEGRTGTARITVTRMTAGQATYRWDVPSKGSRTNTRSVLIKGLADQPGIVSLTINGTAMALKGQGTGGNLAGSFEGIVQLPRKGTNALMLEASTLAGETLRERRDIVFEPILPRLRLKAPEAARPGEEITLEAGPEVGTDLKTIDLTWHGSLLGQLTPPFAVRKVVIPADAKPGTRFMVEAIGRDAEGETVTARAYVTVLGGGATLLLEAFDDRTGLVLAGAQATPEGGSPVELDTAGRATLVGVTGWVKITKAGHVPQWRSASLQTAGAQALVDARLTPLVDATTLTQGQSHDVVKGVLTLKATADVQVQATPLTSQGLPSLLPSGWSAVSAWWLGWDGPAQVRASLALPGSPALSGLVWARWDEVAHAWSALATGLESSSLKDLPVDLPGGYVLVVADPGTLAPPMSEVGKFLAATAAAPWRDDLRATGSVDPSIMPTVAAIEGTRGLARLDLGFATGGAIPSQALIQTEITETYTLVDQSLILPEKRTQDAVAARFLLGVDAAQQPTLQEVKDGLALELPIRMSRTFKATELVEGRILSAFYHDGLAVVTSGQVIESTGGSLTRDGVQVTFPTGALSQATYVQVVADTPQDLARLWPELNGKGTLAKGFTLGFSAELAKGLELAFPGLEGLPSQPQPLLLQRVVAQGQRLVVAVGALTQGPSGWTVVPPAGGNPILQGGSFVILVPTQAWSWVSGATTMPEGMAQALEAHAGLKAKGAFARLVDQRMDARRSLLGRTGAQEALVSTTDVAVIGARVEGNLVDALSGPAGAFAIPAFAMGQGQLTLTGSRWDLGISGALPVQVPSSGNALRLVSRTFGILQVLPAEGAQVEPGTSLMVLLTAPADSQKLAGVALVKLAQDGSMPSVALRRELSLDGRTLVLIPEQNLEPDARYRLDITGLMGLDGQEAPALNRYFQVKPGVVMQESVYLDRIQLPYPDADFNLTLTIPEGAIPATMPFSIEGLGMGSTYSGRMPASGPLAIRIKAWRGERLKITVQFPSGKQFTGTIGRYLGPDGLVTVGPDGGRVEASDGSGAAVILPAGAVEKAVEFRCQVVTEHPDDVAPEVKDTPIFGRVQLLSAEGGTLFKKVPRIEMTVPVGTKDYGVFQGFGGYGVYYRNIYMDPEDGPQVVYEFLDTATVKDGTLKGLGGLPWNEIQEIPDIEPSISLRASASAGEVGSFAGPVTIKCPYALSDYPLGNVMGGFLSTWYGRIIDRSGFTVELDGMVVKKPGKIILKGKAKTQLEGQREYLTVGAPLAFNAGGEKSLKTSGRFVGRTNECGSFMLMNAMFADEVLQIGGALMAQEPEFGQTQVRDWSSFILWDENKSPDPDQQRKLYQVHTFKFDVKAEIMTDHTAPWVDLTFGALDQIGPRTAKDEVVAGRIVAVIQAKDAKDKMNLTVEVRLDDARPTVCGVGPNGPLIHGNNYTFQAMPGQIGAWMVLLDVTPGSHSVEVLVKDTSGNSTRVQRTLYAIDSSLPDPGVDEAKAPKFSVEVEGGLDNAHPRTMIKVAFSERVRGVDMGSLYLEESGESGWTRVREVRTRKIMGADEACLGVVLIPGTHLKLATSYRVVATSGIHDWDLSPEGGKALVQDPVVFKVAGHSEVGSVGINNAGIVASLGPAVFVARTTGSIVMLWNTGSEVRRMNEFGSEEFGTQDIVAMRAFDRVPGLGNEGLLLVTTTPKPSIQVNNSVLWGYRFCLSSGKVSPLFSISIGQNSTGYAPSLDYRDGMILVGRLTSSVLLIPLQSAVDAGISPDATTAMGAGQGAILQPFYLVDPEYTWEEGNTIRAEGFIHSGVAILPSALMPGVTDQSFLRMMVAFGGSMSAQWSGTHKVVGLPNLWYPYTAGKKVTLLPPYVPHGPSVDASKRVFGPPASALVTPNVVGRGSGMTTAFLATWADAEVTLEGRITRTTLAIGVTNNSQQLVILNADTAYDSPNTRAWYWPSASPFPDGAPYKINHRRVSVDPSTGLCAVSLLNQNTETNTWFILSLLKPDQPEVIARITHGKGGWGSGQLSYGYLTLSGEGMVRVYDIRGTQGGSAASAIRLNTHGKSARNMKADDISGCFVAHERISIAVAAGDSQSTKEFYFTSIAKSVDIIKNGNINIEYNGPVMSESSLKQDVPRSVHSVFWYNRSNIKMINTHSCIFRSTYTRCAVDKDGCIIPGDVGDVEVIRPGVLLQSAMSRLYVKKYYNDNKLELKNEVTNNISLPVQFPISIGAGRSVPDLYGEISADLLIMGICEGSAVYDFWKPKVRPVTPGLEPILVATSQRVLDQNSMAGFVLTDLLMNVVADVVAMEAAIEYGTPISVRVRRFADLVVQLYNSRKETAQFHYGNDMVSGNQLAPLEVRNAN